MDKRVISIFLYEPKVSPRRLRVKYTPRTNLRFVLCVFRDCIEPSAAACRRIWREPRNEEIAFAISECALAGSCRRKADMFVNGLPMQSTHLSVTSTSFPNTIREEEALYRETHLYR